MSAATVVFSHGQESGPWGSKIKAMASMARERGWEAESVDYQGMANPGERVSKLIDYCSKLNRPPVLVGSSMGGHVATAAAEAVGAIGLFVLAPAYYMPGYESLTPPAPAIPIEIVHGWHDDIVPVANSLRFAEACSATMHLLDGDHRLTANIGDINNLLALFLGRFE